MAITDFRLSNLSSTEKQYSNNVGAYCTSVNPLFWDEQVKKRKVNLYRIYE